MKAPRDLARRDPWAQSVARALTPPSFSPALAVERDLTDPGVWQESIWRSQRRRDAHERQLNFGPVTGKRVAIPLAMLAAGLVARDAIVSNGASDWSAATGGGATGAHRAASAQPLHHAAKATPPAGVKATRASATAKAGPAAKHAAQPSAASIAAARPAPPKDPMADGELTRGEHGAAVAAVQQKLGLSADGIYGPSTLRAVQAFQKHNGLTADGRVGPATLQALQHPRAIATGKSTAKAQHAPAAPAHAHGAGIKGLQSALKVPADGVFGRDTAHAVRMFQRSHGLKADGVVGPATWSALGVDNPGKVLKEHRARAHGGSSRPAAAHHSMARHGTSVADLQRALGLPADGVFGRQTARAVRQFQRSHGLRADGVVGPATWAALGMPNAHRVLHQRQAAVSRGSSGGGGGGASSGAASSVVQRAIAAADQIATKPYRFGGGHGSFQDTGYDCSGSVSYVLHGAGLLSAPLDSTGLESYGLPGPGRHITIYANSGHAFMTIDGRRFDTGWGGEGNRWASGSRPTGGFVVRHPPGL